MSIPLSYAVGAPLSNDGVFYHFAFELRSNVSRVVRNFRMGKNYVLGQTALRSLDARAFVKAVNNYAPETIGAGPHGALSWNCAPSQTKTVTWADPAERFTATSSPFDNIVSGLKYPSRTITVRPTLLIFCGCERSP